MKVAVAQIAPVLLDREATVARVVERVHEAGRGGAKLVAFGEVQIPGYPVWLDRTGGARFNNGDQKALHAKYLEEAVVIDRGDLDPVRNAAREAGTWVVVGIAERTLDRAGHTIFASCVTIDDAGEVRSVHRKLQPTYEERLAWGPGDAHGLVVHEFGEFRLGSLNCWENWMPLPRAALQAQGENLHVAIWPGSVRNTHDITRHMAKEGRSFVISVGALLRDSDIPAGLPRRADISSAGETIHDGGSCVAAPDGSWVVEPIQHEEGVFFAEIDAQTVLRERQNFDPAGHYARPELLKLTVDRRRVRSAQFIDE